MLDGTLRFTSGAGVVDRALVPVWLAEDTHVLLDLAVADWSFELGAWRTCAMDTTRTAEVRLDRLRVPDEPVGAENSYRERPDLQTMRLGRVWTELTAAVAVLHDAGSRLEDTSELQALATGVRAAVGRRVRRAREVDRASR